MSEQNKIILEDLVKQVKDGTLNLEDIPQGWREKVQEELDNEEGVNYE